MGWGPHTGLTHRLQCLLLLCSEKSKHPVLGFWMEKLSSTAQWSRRVSECEQPRGSEKMWGLWVGTSERELHTHTAQLKGEGSSPLTLLPEDEPGSEQLNIGAGSREGRMLVVLEV